MFTKQKITQVNSRFRLYLNKIHNQIKYNKLSKTYSKRHKGPINVLIELTSTQLKRIESNSIHITKKYVLDNKVYYSNVIYGNSIVKRKKKLVIFGKSTWWSEIMMDNIANGVVYITTTKDELKDDIKSGNIHLIDSNETSSPSSGLVILIICKVAEKPVPNVKDEAIKIMSCLRKLK